MAIMAAADTLMSFLSLKLSSFLGRDIPVIIGYCLDIANYMICVFWIPTKSSLWAVNITFLMFGLIDGIWQPFVNGKNLFFSLVIIRQCVVQPNGFRHL